MQSPDEGPQPGPQAPGPPAPTAPAPFFDERAEIVRVWVRNSMPTVALDQIGLVIAHSVFSGEPTGVPTGDGLDISSDSLYVSIDGHTAGNTLAVDDALLRGLYMDVVKRMPCVDIDTLCHPETYPHVVAELRAAIHTAQRDWRDVEYAMLAGSLRITVEYMPQYGLQLVVRVMKVPYVRTEQHTSATPGGNSTGGQPNG